MSKTIRTKVYQFNELDKMAQSRVYNQRIKDMIEWEHQDHYENWPEYKKAIDKAEEMLTPWFAPSYIHKYCGNEIMAVLMEDTETYYTKTGNIFNK